MHCESVGCLKKRAARETGSGVLLLKSEKAATNEKLTFS